MTAPLIVDLSPLNEESLRYVHEILEENIELKRELAELKGENWSHRR